MELTREEESAVEEFKEGEMTTRLFEIPVLLDGIHSVRALFDGGSAPYGLIDESTARRLNLPRIPLKRKVGIISFGEYTDARVEEVVYTSLDVGGHRQKRVYFYVVPKLVGEAVIIGRPWFKSQKAYLDPEDNLVIQSSGIKINIDAARKDMDCRHVSAVAFTRLAKGKHYRTAGIFAVSMADINRALAVTKKEIPKPRLPPELQQYAAVFERKLAEVLPPLRGPGVDHKIELIPDQDGRQPDLPFGPPLRNEQGGTVSAPQDANRVPGQGIHTGQQFPSSGPRPLCEEAKRWPTLLLRLPSFEPPHEEGPLPTPVDTRDPGGNQ